MQQQHPSLRLSRARHGNSLRYAGLDLGGSPWPQSCGHSHRRQRRRRQCSVCAAQNGARREPDRPPPTPKSAQNGAQARQPPRRSRLLPFSSGPLSNPQDSDESGLFDAQYMSPNPNPIYDEPDPNAPAPGVPLSAGTVKCGGPTGMLSGL